MSSDGNDRPRVISECHEEPLIGKKADGELSDDTGDNNNDDVTDAASVPSGTKGIGTVESLRAKFDRKLKICEQTGNDGNLSSTNNPPGIIGNPDTDVIRSKFEYNMTHVSRGKAIIVNNVNFSRESGMTKRAGSEKDADELTDVLRMLGFSTERYSDVTCLQLIRIFQNVSTEDHSDYDCFMFAIMTHGTDGAVYCTDGVISPDEIMQELKGDRCPTLTGKPKIFFIQACRGQLFDGGVTVAVEEADETDGGIPRHPSLVIPAEADFLVAYSSPPGYYSWRNISSGAWFIQALIRILKDAGTSLEINQLLTRVSYTVAYEYISSSSVPDFNQKKQMPFYTSTLTKELFFRPKNNHAIQS